MSDKRLQRPLVGAGDHAAAAAVVEQRIDRLLQHALLVAHDDVGRAQLDQPLEPVVAVDHPAVEVVQVRGREAAAVERHQRPQLGRDHRDDRQDHPLRPVAGLEEGLDQLEALDDLLALGLGVGLDQLQAQRVALLREIERGQHLAHRLGADPDREAVLAILLAMALDLLVGQELMALERGQAGLDDHEVLEVEDALEIAQRHVQDDADPARHRLQEPDVRDRRRQIDVADALAADLALDDLDAALLADDAAVLHPLVLAAQALVVLDRPEDPGAEQAVPLRLEGPVVDRLGLLDLAVGPGADLLRAGDRDLDLVELERAARLPEEVHQLVHISLLSTDRMVVRPSRPGRPGGQSSPASCSCCSSTFRPNACSSLTRTLKDSGMPASKVSSPRTIAS